MVTPACCVLELVPGFQSLVGRTDKFICDDNESKRNLMLRAPTSVGRGNSMRVDEGRGAEILSR